MCSLMHCFYSPSLLPCNSTGIWLSCRTETFWTDWQFAALGLCCEICKVAAPCSVARGEFVVHDITCCDRYKTVNYFTDSFSPETHLLCQAICEWNWIITVTLLYKRSIVVIFYLTLRSTKVITVPHWIIWSWSTGHWWVGCYIWYSEEGTGQGCSPPRSLLAVPNVTAHPSTPVTILGYNGPLLCGFIVPIEGLIGNLWSIKGTLRRRLTCIFFSFNKKFNI